MSKEQDVCFTFLGFGIGFALACLISFLGHPAVGAALIPILFFLGLLSDGGRFLFRTWITWTAECSYCSHRVSPLTRNRFLSTDLSKSGHWFCSPKCYLEFHRRFYTTERKQVNILGEGEPIIKLSEK